jgi:CheY-like chemotaxis protein
MSYARAAVMLVNPLPKPFPSPRPPLTLVVDRVGPLPFVAPTPNRGTGPRLDPATCEVLVVDDDPSILATVSEILKDEGIQVVTATNGQEALQILERVKPWVVLLDMRMPVMDGWTFARVARDRGEEVPILVMTAAQDARRWAAEINADGYLSKPFDLGDLLDAVERFRRDS